MLNIQQTNIEKAVALISKAQHAVVFTGAGISVESGIPAFRGEGGLWNKYDPQVLDINYFLAHPSETWQVIREIFYDFMLNTNPNPAHTALAVLEKKGLLKAVMTQNIDGLHQKAGSEIVYEFHGTSQNLVCLSCRKKIPAKYINFEKLPPLCPICKTGILKPDFIFFGEGIPAEAYQKSFEHARKADVFIIIGTSGEVAPASYLPSEAKKNGASIIEINLNRTNYSETVSDIFIKGKASEILTRIAEKV